MAQYGAYEFSFNLMNQPLVDDNGKTLGQVNSFLRIGDQNGQSVSFVECGWNTIGGSGAYVNVMQLIENNALGLIGTTQNASIHDNYIDVADVTTAVFASSASATEINNSYANNIAMRTGVVIPPPIVQTSGSAPVVSGGPFSFTSAKAQGSLIGQMSATNPPTSSWAISGDTAGDFAISSSGAITAAQTLSTSSNEAITVTATNAFGNGSLPVNISWTISSGTAGGVARPAFNTGVGFFTLSGSGAITSGSNSNIYDATGHIFTPRGVNRTHYNDASDLGILNSKANIERYKLFFGNGTTSQQFVTLITNGLINNKIIPIVTEFTTSTGVTTSGDTNPATITQCVNDWINGVNGSAGAAAWKTIEQYMILNIANEWGPQSSVWRDTYITAVSNLRTAGFNGMILIDAPGSGQDGTVVVNGSINSTVYKNSGPCFGTVLAFGSAIIQADPQHNIAFGCHVYTNIQQTYATSQLAPMSTSGLPFIVSEFGPGRGIGPAPTDLTPGELISACEAIGKGWIARSWDDNDLANSASDDSGFAMVYQNNASITVAAPNGGYGTSNSADLSIYGQNVVLGINSGGQAGKCLTALATPCSVFS